jgi:hypothetical protein
MISDMNKKIVGILVFIIVIIIELLKSRDGSGLTCPNNKLYNSGDGRCYECLSSADCSSGNYCDRGACVTTGSTEFGCIYTDEDGECVRCETNRDCLLGQDCIDGNCEQIGTYICSSNDDCGAARPNCIDGMCQLECVQFTLQGNEFYDFSGFAKLCSDHSLHANLLFKKELNAGQVLALLNPPWPNDDNAYYYRDETSNVILKVWMASMASILTAQSYIPKNTRVMINSRGYKA